MNFEHFREKSGKLGKRVRLGRLFVQWACLWSGKFARQERRGVVPTKIYRKEVTVDILSELLVVTYAAVLASILNRRFR